MAPTQEGSFRLFNFRGINVYIHWMWFLAGAWVLDNRSSSTPIFWSVMEYLGLFGIVLLHEFGHSFATRSVGGTADTIVLWPLGGVAYVRPPHRPGAQLWGIAAGPLVNVALMPVFWGLIYVMGSSGAAASGPDTMRLLWRLEAINQWIFLFNMLPIYPLDGGQILRSLLWFGMGSGRSLQVAVVIGLAAAVVGGLWALSTKNMWRVLMAAYVFMQCLSAWKHARALLEAESGRGAFRP